MEVQDAMGIAKGAMVRSGGIKIGRIGEISFSEKSELVKIEMLIY